MKHLTCTRPSADAGQFREEETRKGCQGQKLAFKQMHRGCEQWRLSASEGSARCVCGRV